MFTHSELSRCLFAQHQLLNFRSHEQRIETSHLPELKSKLAFERSFAPIQKIEAAFLPLLFSIYLKCATESPPCRRPPPKPRRKYRASRKTEWPGRVSSRPFKADTSFLLRPSADGAPRRAACPSRAAPRLQAPELGCLGLPWRSRRVGPAC